MSISRHRIQSFFIGVFCLIAYPAYSEPLSSAINVETAINSAAIRSQKKIDSLSDKTRKMLDQYRSATHQVETLTVYNKHLKDLLNSQKLEKSSLEQQLKDIETTQREIVPLILRMLDSLDKFVALDVPFLPEELGQQMASVPGRPC